MAGAHLLVDSAGRIVESNNAADSLLGRSRSEFSSLFEEPSGSESEDRYRRVKDSLIWVELVESQTEDEMTLVAVVDRTEEVRARAILERSLYNVVVLDEDGNRLWGPRGREHIGVQPYDEGSTPITRVHPEDVHPAIRAQNEARGQPGVPVDTVLRIANRLGDGHWSRTGVTFIDYSDRSEIGGLLLIRPRLGADTKIESLGSTSSAFLSVAEVAPIGIILTGPEGRAVYTNPAMRAMVPDLKPDGESVEWVFKLTGPDREAVMAWYSDLVGGQESGSMVVCLRAPPDPCWAMVTAAPHFDDERRVIGFVVTLQDITAQVMTQTDLTAARDQLEHLARHDHLTGLRNRRSLPTEVPDQNVAVLYLDLDGFKPINDEYGHAAGDQVLAEVAHRIKAEVREADSAYRSGGDEFIMLAPGMSRPGALKLAERLRRRIAEPIELDGGDLAVGVSVGIAIQEPEEPLPAAIVRADQAMYDEKSSRRTEVKDNSR